MTLSALLLMLAFVCFVTASIPRFSLFANFIAIGLALWSLSIIVASGVIQ